VTTREVYFAGIATNATGKWTTQAARNLFLGHADQLTGSRALVRDRGSQFIDAFDEIFRTERLKILKTPVRTPVANTFAERWIGTLRRELLDPTIIWNQHQLNRLVTDYVDHYNTHQATRRVAPHRSLDQRIQKRRDAYTQERGPGPARPCLSSGFAIQHASKERHPHPMHFVSPSRKRWSSAALSSIRFSHSPDSCSQSEGEGVWSAGSFSSSAPISSSESPIR
jgi:hypothetical protein